MRTDLRDLQSFNKRYLHFCGGGLVMEFRPLFPLPKELTLLLKLNLVLERLLPTALECFSNSTTAAKFAKDLCSFQPENLRSKFKEYDLDSSTLIKMQGYPIYWRLFGSRFSRLYWRNQRFQRYFDPPLWSSRSCWYS